jgi:glycosyltransferase involved in cell wall biosynthesis
MNKPRVLIFCDYYPPGNESSGGMRTIVNTIERLADEFDFWVITRYHEKIDYNGLKIGDWNYLENAKVFYIQRICPLKLRKLIKSISPDTIYSNSFFSTFTVNLVLLKKLRLIDVTLVIAPEGELSKGALSLKRRKKSIYLYLAKLFGLYENLIWKATSELEKAEIQNYVDGKIFVVPNMPPKEIFPSFNVELKPRKNEKEVRLVFLSRIHPKKNLKFLLNLLTQYKDDVLLDVYGLEEDKDYLNDCLKIANRMNERVKVRFRGEVRNKDVPATLFDYHFFVLPTLGENFGHVIVEALAAGCPLIISNTTPWQRLDEKGIGWDLPLDDCEAWHRVLNFCINMDDVTFKDMSLKARNFIELWLKLKNKEIEEAKKAVLVSGLSKTFKK